MGRALQAMKPSGVFSVCRFFANYFTVRTIPRVWRMRERVKAIHVMAVILFKQHVLE